MAFNSRFTFWFYLFRSHFRFLFRLFIRSRFRHFRCRSSVVVFRSSSSLSSSTTTATTAAMAAFVQSIWFFMIMITMEGEQCTDWVYGHCWKLEIYIFLVGEAAAAAGSITNRTSMNCSIVAQAAHLFLLWLCYFIEFNGYCVLCTRCRSDGVLYIVVCALGALGVCACAGHIHYTLTTTKAK